ncbi:MAG: hypothetical protein M1821_006907 [Bathelium mastoideum]|nr:MAG: hypothetical protein M1821_006907 [Bathelium mastoideum]KAI9687635.1 MAG: hypothetical protein M1822_002245 [Bathelium mastoideum]
MNIPRSQPSTWEEYEQGPRRGSSGSGQSRVHFDPYHRSSSTDAPDQTLHLPDESNGRGLRHRRSSMSMRFTSLRQMGGVNSFDNFARSWQRAAGFVEVTPIHQSFVSVDDGNVEHGRSSAAGIPSQERTSLLRAAFESEGRRISENAIAVEEDNAAPVPEDAIIDESMERRINESRVKLSSDNIFSVSPHLASPFSASYGTMYGSLRDRINEPAMEHAGKLFKQQQVAGASEPDKDREPLLVKQVLKDDGKTINVVVGQSTLPQTIFNSVNVLVGVGLLALPLSFRYSGWLIGMLFFLSSAITTSYTAKVLAKCLDVDNSLITFADIGYVAFGSKARIAISILFTLELFAACVALVVLFADSLDALIPVWSVLEWKVICGIILIPLSFLPLRFLSFTSVLGILCCFGIVLAIFIDGFIKPDKPGSLREPATTYLFPTNWATLPLSFGLMMSPWGGHGVFPNIYRDMRHPHKYSRAVNITYVFSYFIDVAIAVAGLLMFGNQVRDEITSNLLLTDGYPKGLSVFIVICIAIIPITKVPLNGRPIISTLEILLGLDARALSTTSQSTAGMSSFTRGVLKITIRALINVVFVVLAILVPNFDRIMGIMGSVACFTICIILPLAFHLKLFGEELSRWRWWGEISLMGLSVIFAIAGTVGACLPKEMINAET